jgi:hypothetical protein
VKILVGLPNTGTFPMETVSSLTNLKNPAEAAYMFISGSLIYKARENIADEMLKHDFTHLLFVDSDMSFPPDALKKLVSHDKDIVSGRAHKRVANFEPCFYKKCDWKEAIIYHDYPEGLIEVAAVGMAFCLIKREVFEKVSKPWFNPTFDIGEDLAFCMRAQEAGFKIWVDTDLEIGHVGNAIFGGAHYKHVRGIS